MSKKQTIFSGADSHLRIKDILKENNISKFLLVCDKGPYENSFLKDYFESIGIDFVIFSDFTPNPVYEEVRSGVKLFLDEECQFIISVGGGSAIDVAKCIKLFSTMDQDKLYLEQEYKENDILHLALPTTAGTGSESTHFAVLYYEGEKKSIAEQSIRPDYAVLEPRVLVTLPEYQKKSTLMDALCQAIESYWSVNSTEESKELSRKSIDKIIKYMKPYLANDEEATNHIMLASNMSGQAINITTTTAAHAMSYKLTSMYKISHGHAVGCCLPFVWMYMINHMDKCVDPRGTEYLKKTFKELAELLYCKTSRDAARFMRALVKRLDLHLPDMNSEEDIEVLAKSVNAQRLANNPVALDDEALVELYEYVLKKRGFNGEMVKEQQEYLKLVLEKARMFDEIKEIQAYALDILKDVDKICKEHNIQYFLGEGTLLGAIRHKGFIPWDDDIDILMYREDFDKFLEIFPKVADKKYAVASFATFDKHWSIPVKVINTEIDRFEYSRFTNVGLKTGPFIDIFPLDYLPKMDRKKLLKRGRYVDNLKYLLWYKTGYIQNPETGKRKFLKFSTKFMTYKKIRKTIVDAMTRFNNKPNSNLVVNYGSLYKIQKEIVPKKYYGTPRMVEFEDMIVPIPEMSEKILEQIYGNYMKLPPIEERFPKHKLKVRGNTLE